jgi:hypothetical protein
MRTEQEIRARISELNKRQKGFSWDDPARAVHAKTALRAQMKGLYYSLGEESLFSITGD